MRNGTLFRCLTGIGLLALPLIGIPLLQSRELPRELNAHASGGRNAPQAFGILFEVNSTGDGNDAVHGDGLCETAQGNGVCTLRAAIQEANAQPTDDTIDFNIPSNDPGYNNGVWTINLGAVLPDLNTNLNITGPGMDQLVVTRNSSSSFRIFNVTAPGTVSLSGMTITNGYATNGSFPGNGGGINKTSAGTLNITNCTISNNFGSAGGGINNDSSGTINITNSTLNGNSAFDGGGLRSNGGTVNLSGTTVNGNTANSSGGAISGSGHGAGILVSAGTMNVTNSTLSGNLARDVGGGGSDIDGGGIYNGAGTVNLTNSTLSGNHANQDGGGIYNKSALNLSNCTMTGNGAVIAGGIYNDNAGSATIKSSIIALNSSITHNLNGIFITGGFNLIGTDDGGPSFPAGNPNANNDIVGTNASPIDPKLDPRGLQNNGGPTLTIALLPGSPAIDKGTSNGLTGALTTDGRGTGFVRTADYPSIPNATGGNGTDIGAIEFWTLKITSVTHLTNGHIVLQGVGVPSGAHTLYSSPDLSSGFTAPTPVTADATGALTYDDAGAVGLTKRFYRLSFP
jgi:CSLREA domain-containing protein